MDEDAQVPYHRTRQARQEALAPQGEGRVPVLAPGAALDLIGVVARSMRTLANVLYADNMFNPKLAEAFFQAVRAYILWGFMGPQCRNR